MFVAVLLADGDECVVVRERGVLETSRFTVELGGCFFFFDGTAATEIYTLSLLDALPI